MIRYAERDGVDPLDIRGSIYGAIGMCQFMPTNVFSFGVDATGTAASTPSPSRTPSTASPTTSGKTAGTEPGPPWAAPGDLRLQPQHRLREHGPGDRGKDRHEEGLPSLRGRDRRQAAKDLSRAAWNNSSSVLLPILEDVHPKRIDSYKYFDIFHRSSRQNR